VSGLPDVASILRSCRGARRGRFAPPTSDATRACGGARCRANVSGFWGSRVSGLGGTITWLYAAQPKSPAQGWRGLGYWRLRPPATHPGQPLGPLALDQGQFLKAPVPQPLRRRRRRLFRLRPFESDASMCAQGRRQQQRDRDLPPTRPTAFTRFTPTYSPRSGGRWLAASAGSGFRIPTASERAIRVGRHITLIRQLRCWPQFGFHRCNGKRASRRQRRGFP